MKSRQATARSWACGVALLASLCGPLPSTSDAAAEPTTTTTAPSLPLVIVSQKAARVPPSGVTASRGPAGGQVGLVFTSSQTGYLAAVPQPPTSGYATGATSELQRTTTGGASWATVWQGRDIVLHWVGAVGPRVVATGLGARGPLLLESTDGGASWHEVPVTVSVPSVSAPAGGADWYWASSALYFLNQRVGFAYPDAMFGQAGPSPDMLFRTTDGGRRWAAVPFVGGSPSGGLAFVNATHGFATGLSEAPSSGSTPRGCTSRIWQSSDGGASWHPVPGTCEGYLLTSLSFPTPSRGYAGGGNYAKYSLAPQLAVLATVDGGRHWSQVFRTPGATSVRGAGYGGPFGELDFYNPAQGLALAGGCTGGANGPCVGQVWWTDDAGRSWSPRGEYGSQLVTAGQEGAWLSGGGPTGSNVLWRSSDGGRSWVPVAQAAQVRLSGLLAAGERLWVDSEAGQFMSEDEGRAWHDVPAAALAAEGGPLGAQLDELGDAGLVVVETGMNTLWISQDGGRRGRALPLPGLGPAGASAVSFANDEDGLALGWGSCAALKPVQPPVSLPLRATTVALTTDGGAHWQDVGKVDVWGYGGLAYSQGLAVAAATCGKGIATSTDGGRSWTYWSVPQDLSGCLQPSASGQTVALSCPSYGAGTATLRLLVSQDAGRQWSVYELAGPGAQEVQGVVAAGPGVLWAFGQEAGQVWRSTDGGATWGQSNLALPVRP